MSEVSAFRQKGPAEAGTPTRQVKMDNVLAVYRLVDAMMTFHSKFDKRIGFRNEL
jgi:hypothetical protein